MNPTSPKSIFVSPFTSLGVLLSFYYPQSLDFRAFPNWVSTKLLSFLIDSRLYHFYCKISIWFHIPNSKISLLILPSADPPTDAEVYMTFSSSQLIDSVTDSAKSNHMQMISLGILSIQIIFMPILYLNNNIWKSKQWDLKISFSSRVVSVLFCFVLFYFQN